MPAKRLLSAVMIVVLCFSFASVSVGAQGTLSADLLAEFETLIQAEMDDFDIPGAAVAVIASGEVVYAQGFGARDLATGDPFTTETRFRIGSTTKSMTSLLIAQLVDDGLLSWDTPVTDLLPTFQTADPALTARITVRDLLGMGTGLVSRPVDGVHWGEWDTDALLTAIASQAIDGQFGETYHYNNEVYALAGYVGTVAAGLEPTLDNYHALMQQRVFDPIGLDSAIITDDMGDLGANFSQSYELSVITGEPLLMINPPIGIVAPAGAVWMNIEDMARYVMTQMNGGITPDGVRIVEETTLAETWKPGVPVDFDAPGMTDTRYGMGWVSLKYLDIPVRFHDGGWAGYTTQMMILPDADVAVLVFANSSLGGLFGQALIYAFSELLYDLEPAALDYAHAQLTEINTQINQLRPLVSIEIPNALALPLVGSYEDGWTIEQREDSSLWFRRGEWIAQIGYIALLNQYVLLNGGLTGVLITVEAEGDALTLSLQVGETDTLRLQKLE